jgi:hypothetical protein
VYQKLNRIESENKLEMEIRQFEIDMAHIHFKISISKCAPESKETWIWLGVALQRMSMDPRPTPLRSGKSKRE